MLEKIKVTIDNFYPSHTLASEEYYHSANYKKLRELINERHLNRDQVILLIEELKVRYKDRTIDDLIMGGDFPCYIVQIILENNKNVVRTCTVYISFIYPVHACLCQEMEPPWDQITIVNPKALYKELFSTVNTLTRKIFHTTEITQEIFGIKLDNIWLRSEFTVFNALFHNQYKIV